MFSHSTVFAQQASDAWLIPIKQGSGTSAAGVYLIQGSATGHDRAYSAVLTLSLINGQTVDVDVLVTRNGQIQEMATVSAGIRAIRLNASNSSAASKISVSLRRLSWPEYRFRQLRRVVPVFWSQTQERRARAGLRWRTMFSNLNHAYAVSCRFRANAYMRSYADWHAEFYSVSPEDRHLMQKHLRHWRRPPHFQVVVLVGEGGQTEISEIDSSLDNQIYPHFSRIHLPYDGWAQALADRSEIWTQEAGAVSTDESVRGTSWTIVLKDGIRLSEAALYWLAHTIDSDATRQLGVVYADHDTVGDDGRLVNPAFKPDWSAELLRATNYIGNAFAWRTRSLSRIWDAARAMQYSVDGAFHSLLLALTADTPDVGHVCAPLWHVDATYDRKDVNGGAETSELVAAHLQSQGIKAVVTAAGSGRCHVRYVLPDPSPLVSIVIPTRDGLVHLRRCIDSLLTKTSYQEYEIIVVDNQSVQADTIAYLRAVEAIPNVRVLPFDEAFNYSKINNYAVRQARGDLICLLNNDTEVISPDWLAEMVGLVLQPGIGAVGAKLLYDNDTVQHGGDTVGPGGCANHLHSGLGRDEPGYCGRAVVAQDLSAVTAACLLTHKSLYQSLGGLNEANLTVAFNDVDFCLRIRDAGKRVLWTPHALLYHHESITRGKDISPAQIQRARSEVEYMRYRWAHLMHHDPFYNPNLNYQHPDFGLSGMPHVNMPWGAK
ncbi:glycosyltransferase family 2 protein [Bordetella genomosp. 4]|uniref:glycosyltransferase family 2 protein n=1 Tax=Bordetella genomosp. 4 TaxID=463044 RepID=UPI0020CD7568|nr:glycosyltransferase family 2 protein [Bordetella genomosp. 4]